MKVYNHKDAFVHLNYILKFQKEDSFIAVFTEPAVHYGEDLQFDENKVHELNLETFNLQRKGGAIIASPGDIVYCFTSKEENSRFNAELRKFLAKKLTDRCINIEQIKNDLLVNDKKCFGFMHQKIGKLHFYGGHISINCNLELIKELCTKEMIKMPGGLGEYNITSEDVIEWLKEFWFYYKK